MVMLMGTAQQMGVLHVLCVPSLGSGRRLASPGPHEHRCGSGGGLHGAMLPQGDDSIGLSHPQHPLPGTVVLWSEQLESKALGQLEIW